MALINIAFGFVGGEGGPDNHPPLFRKSGAAQTITSAATSQQSSASSLGVSRGVGASALRLYTDTNIWYEIGTNPAAVANTSIYLPAGAVEYVYLSKGDKVAVLVA